MKILGTIYYKSGIKNCKSSLSRKVRYIEGEVKKGYTGIKTLKMPIHTENISSKLAPKKTLTK